MSIKLYLASPFSDKDKMPELAKQFEDRGFVITRKWWEVEDKTEAEKTPQFLRGEALSDIEGVKAANVVVLFNTKKSEGKAVEQGIAIANNIPIFAIGKRGAFSKNVFHYLEHYFWVETLHDVLVILDFIKAVCKRS